MSEHSDRPARRNVAVILAGGVGTRVGLGIPKQLIKVAGRTILEHTIAVFDRHPLVDEVVVMMTPGHLDAVHAMTRGGRYPKVTRVLEGDSTRSGTTMRALDSLGPEECHVMLHDSVRPLVSERIISDCFAALATHDAVDVAIPSADTVIEVDEHDEIRHVPSRAATRRGQTPQAFLSSVLRAAYAAAAADPDFESTDECSVVHRYLPHVPVVVVRGDESNMKVTEPIDVFVADKLFQLMSRDRPAPREEAGFSKALAGTTMVVFGGSYGIGADIVAMARAAGAHVLPFSRSTTQTHVERRADVTAAARQALEETGRIDHVVMTAGVLPRGTLLEATEETVYAATEINYLAPIFVAQEFFPHLRATGGSMLMFTSSSYTRGRAGYSLYSSAKAALVNLVQALADEWAEDGVRINCVNPERTGTPMRSKAFGAEPPDTLLESATVARAALDVLLSPQTGTVVDVRRDDPLAGVLAGAEGRPEV